MRPARKPHSKTWWQSWGRATAAYCASSVAAGVALGVVAIPLASGVGISQVFTGGPAIGLLLAPFIAAVALIPSMTMLAVVKDLGLRRGISDTIAGGVVGAGLITLFNLLGSSSFDFSRIALLEAAQFGIAGLVGGFSYWFVGGRPRSRREADARDRIDPSIFD